MTASLLEQLIEALRVLPGVGQKSAQRMAYHVLERNRDGGKRLADALAAAVERIGQCSDCRDFSESEVCATCASAALKRSMAAVGPRFNTQRMLYQYADSMYCPAIRRHARLGEHEAAGAISLTEWVRRLRAAWPQVRFTDIHSEAQDGISVRQELVFGCVVYLGALDPADVVVQVCLGRADAAGEITDYHIVDMVHSGTEDDGNHVYKANAQFDTSGLSGYTMRILPRHPDVLGAQLPGLVRWADEGV